jgi:hypothetical protein
LYDPHFDADNYIAQADVRFKTYGFSGGYFPQAASDSAHYSNPQVWQLTLDCRSESGGGVVTHVRKHNNCCDVTTSSLRADPDDFTLKCGISSPTKRDGSSPWRQNGNDGRMLLWESRYNEDVDKFQDTAFVI